MPLILPAHDDKYEYHDTAPEPVGYFVGLDLGQSRDWSAVVINRKDEARRYIRGTTRQVRTIVLHNVVRMHRYPLGTLYPDIARSIYKALEQLPTLPRLPQLIVDNTGVGRGVTDVMKELGLQPRCATITGGTGTSGTHSDFRIAKKLLASTLDAVMSEGRLKVSDADALASELVSELRNFTVRVTSAGNETMAAARERDHDDLTIATCLAVWAANQPKSGHVQRIPY